MLNLKDRLSHLTFRQCCKLLGPNGAQLLRAGGKYEIDIAEHVRLEKDLFQLDLGEAVVSITQDLEKGKQLNFNCSVCHGGCEHIGAAFSLILEEKLSLGLAAPPPERVPIESLSDEELVLQAINERAERARIEKMTIRSLNPKELWTDYIVTNASSGKSYRVALRGWHRGESYCTCPDFRKNTLGTCKHILHVTAKVEGRFNKDVRQRPFENKGVCVYVRYGEDLELRLLIPEGLDKGILNILRPIKDAPITDVSDLLKRVREIENRGEEVVIYPDAEDVINRAFYLERISKKVHEIRQDPKNHPFRKTLLKTELLPYQLDGIAFAVGAGRAIIADDMGLGKTIQGVGVAELLAQDADVSKILIVCPASLKSQWRLEIRRFTGRDCQMVLGSSAQRAEQYDGPSFFTICNYEQVLRDILSVERVKWDLIILDEGQRIKNWETKTSQVIKALSSPFALVLTGTPLENRLDDLFSIVEFIDDRRLGPAFRFFNKYRVTDQKGKLLGYKNLDDLRQRLQPLLLRRTRKMVMKDLPARTTEIRRIAPTDEQYAINITQKRIIQSIITKKYISEMDLLRLQKALLICRMAADSTFLVDKQAPGYSSKLEEIDVMLDQLMVEEDRKIIMFSEWTTMLNLIEPLLEKRGLEYVRLDGSIPQKKRQALIHRFQNDPDCKLFITTNAGSTGLNLQAANTVINVDLPWNPAVLEQRIGRAHRMGQKRPVQVYLLVTEETIEENLLITLSAKQGLFLAALDPETQVTSLDMAAGIEELKSRLEILLGAKPEAALDESMKQEAEKEAERLERKGKISKAGGELLGAAFKFIGELFPERKDTDRTIEIADSFKAKLSECLEEGENGELKMTVTLPNREVLENLARSLARMAAGDMG